MNYAAIKTHDVANGPGVRVSLFVSGCTRHCPGCFNSETWDFEYGHPFTAETRKDILKMLESSHIEGLSILGGEPFELENQFDILTLVRDVRKELPDKSIWAYSGYTFSDLMSRPGSDGTITKQLIGMLDVLVDGPFVEARKNLGLRFRGSENQRIIDVKQTMRSGTLTLWDEGGLSVK